MLTDESTDELFDLQVTEKGYRNAIYANVDPGGASCAKCCSTVYCTCCKFW
jgi:hypothetical protein